MRNKEPARKTRIDYGYLQRRVKERRKIAVREESKAYDKKYTREGRGERIKSVKRKSRR